jgi:hypothetical protein
MSLFSLDNILLNESTDGTSSPADMINFDHMQCLDDSVKNFSFVQEGYNFILDMRQNYIDAEKTFYENVLGSYGDDEIITESFSGFFDKIKEIIHKFIEWIKKIFKQFVLKMNSLFSNEKYIKKHHKLLSKFGYNDEFEFKGYEFTYIEDSTMPAANALSAFTSTTQGQNYFDTWYDSDNNKNNLDMSTGTESERRNQTDKLNAKLDTKLTDLQDNLEDFYDKFRGLVINKSNEKFDSSEFPEELFRVFRNDDNEPSSITIDSGFVTEAYRRFDKYKDTVKAIEKTQKEMIKDYEALEKYLDKLVKLNKADKQMTLGIYDAMPNTFGANQIGTMITGNISTMNNRKVYDSSTFDKLNNYMKVQSAKVNEMCTIHTQAFTAKLEAAKDCFKQDKKILYKALNKIVGRSNKDNY